MSSWRRWVAGLSAVVWCVAGGVFASSARAGDAGTDTLTFSSTPPSTVAVGDGVTLSVELSWASTGTTPITAPTGSVTFTAPGGTPCSGTLSAPSGDSETATCKVTAEAAGASAWTASYGGNSQLPSSEASTPVTVSAAPTTTALTSSGSPSALGSSVEFTATVATPADSYGPGGPVANGVVTFYVAGSTALCSNVAVDATGTAKCGAVLESGTDQITASYSDASSSNPSQNLGNYTSSVSAPLSQTISQDATTTQIIQAPATAALGTSLTFIAQVSPSQDQGTVAFGGDPDVANACPAAKVTNGQATCDVTVTTPGQFAVTAAYSGDTDYTGSTSSATTLNVTSTAANATLTGNKTTILTPLTLTVTAVPPAGYTVAGSFDFNFDNHLDVGALGISTACSAVQIVSGKAVCKLSPFIDSGGPFTLDQDSYSTYWFTTFNPGPDNTVSGALSNGFNETVTLVPTKITIASAPAFPTAGKPMALMAKVSPIPTTVYTNGDGGKVRVSANLVVIDYGSHTCDATINDSTGYAVCDITAPKAGTYVTKAVFDGEPPKTDNNNAEGIWARSVSKSLSIRVGDETLTKVTAEQNPVGARKLTTYHAAVFPDVTGTGTVAFFYVVKQDGKDKAEVLGGCSKRPISKLSIASCTVAINSPGHYPVFAVYSGGGKWAPSQSPNIDELVN